MKKIMLIVALLVAGAGAAHAQEPGVPSGRVVTAPYWDTGRMLLFSQSDYTMGTTRSATMGGAFASLGADLSSMNINPAGMGMYQSSDWGATAALAIDKMRTTSEFMRPGNLLQGGNRTSFGLNNIGAAYNVFNSSGAFTSLTLGFSYNRTANFNSRTAVDTFGEDSSITEMWQNQLNLLAHAEHNPLTYDDLEPENDPFGGNYFFPDEWGAIMGYQTGLVTGNDRGDFSMFPGAIPSDSYFGAVTRGGIYEYGFSLGANISNILYLGTTVNISEINYKEELTYEEMYYQGAAFGKMWMDQTTRVAGAGISAKFGAIVRPTPALRLGVAFHLPTYYTIDKSYWAVTGIGDNTWGADIGQTVMHQQRFNTAPRLLAGVSAVLGGRAIVALDYEVAWYNKIRVRSENWTEVEESKADSEMFYKPGQTLRVGFEHAGNVFSLRAGGSYMFDFMKPDEWGNPWVVNNPAPISGYTLSAGLGFNIGRNGYVDLGYIYRNTKWNNYDFYFLDDGEFIASQYDEAPGGALVAREYTPHRNHHTITLTIGNRF